MNHGNRNNCGKNENSIENHVPAINSILFPISGGEKFNPRLNRIRKMKGEIRDPSMKNGIWKI